MSLPIGTILPYVGDLSKIPQGWRLCDGSNGTPNLSGRFLEGVSSEIGYFKEAGLPNITGEFSADQADYHYRLYSGAFYDKERMGHGDNGEAAEAEIAHFIFDASRSSPVYGRSSTVQPASYTVYYIMRIK